MPLYTGIKEIILSDQDLATFYETKKCPVELIQNEYLIIKNQSGDYINKFRFDGVELIPLKKNKFKNFKPLDDIQSCAYDSLFDPNIKVVCLTGKSGTGKTKTAVSVGIELMRNGVYDKLILIRHAVESGESIGLLPGSKDEKMINGWAGCFYDNIPDNRFGFEQLMQQGRIEIESISLLKGRDLKNSYVIFDECEDAHPEHIELVGSRINDSSKCVFVGDYSQTSKQKFKSNSGLLKLIEKAKGKSWFSCIELQTNGRGVVAQFFATEFKQE